MNRKHFIKLFFIMFVFSFIGCDKDVINNENGDIINENETTNETPNNGEVLVEILMEMLLTEILEYHHMMEKL